MIKSWSTSKIKCVLEAHANNSQRLNPSLCRKVRTTGQVAVKLNEQMAFIDN